MFEFSNYEFLVPVTLLLPTVSHLAKEQVFSDKLSELTVLWQNTSQPYSDRCWTMVKLMIRPFDINIIIGKVHLPVKILSFSLLTLLRHRRGDSLTRLMSIPVLILFDPKSTDVTVHSVSLKLLLGNYEIIASQLRFNSD